MAILCGDGGPFAVRTTELNRLMTFDETMTAQEFVSERWFDECRLKPKVADRMSYVAILVCVTTRLDINYIGGGISLENAVWHSSSCGDKFIECFDE